MRRDEPLLRCEFRSAAGTSSVRPSGIPIRRSSTCCRAGCPRYVMPTPWFCAQIATAIEDLVFDAMYFASGELNFFSHRCLQQGPKCRP